MEDFFLKLIPLYSIIFLGFIAGKYLNVQRESIAPLLIYIINPVVFFFGILNYEFQASTLLLPVLVFGISLIAAIFYLKVSSCFFQDYRKNLLALIAGTGNTGYFGLPVAMILFGPNALGITILAMLGRTIFEQSVGFFITANGAYSLKESLIKTAQVPTLYAAIFAIIIKLNNLDLSANLIFNSFEQLSVKFIGTYSILGMLIIGLGLSQIHLLKFNKDLLKFISLSFIASFILSPLLTLALIYCDLNSLHLFNHNIHEVLILLSIVPIASNTITFATQFGYEIEPLAFTVFLSTLFAIFYIPFVVALF